MRRILNLGMLLGACISASMVNTAFAIEITNPYVGKITPPRPGLGIQPQHNGGVAHPQNSTRNIPAPRDTLKIDKGPDSRHTLWCQNRYKTYRPSDNSYASQIGVRKTCQSPYQ